MPVIVFDLDDTLYDEITFVHSGFRAVAQFLEQQYGIASDESLPFMLDTLERDGRGQVFDSLLRREGRYTKQLARQCLAVYRSHQPNIALNSDAVTALERLSSLPLYIVTDGNKHVQYNKLQALGLTSHPSIRRCFISRRFGIHNEKPSPHCFHLICQAEQAAPQEIVYVGDNPNKDFVGIKPLGFRTIRVLRGHYADLRKPDAYEADCEIHDLSGLDELIRSMFTNSSISR